MDPEALVGQQIDRYLIKKHIDRGGMADVYLAYEADLDRYAAIKVILPAYSHDEELLARFDREGQSSAHIIHPNVIQVYASGITPTDQPYLAMEFCEGGSLERWLKKLVSENQLLPTSVALALVRQMADALRVVHSLGIVHRDLKPSNILLRRDGTPVLTDLGIAATQVGTRLTQTGSLLGTVQYMSPEQAAGNEVDNRSDLYSLGIILYELLAGRRPFDAEEALAVLHKQIYEEPPKLQTIRPGLSGQIYAIVQRSLHKNPAERFNNAQEMVFALDQAVAAEGITEEEKSSGIWRPFIAGTGLLSRRQVLREAKVSDGVKKPVKVRPLYVIVPVALIAILFILFRSGNSNGPPERPTAVDVVEPATEVVVTVEPSTVVVVEVTSKPVVQIEAPNPEPPTEEPPTIAPEQPPDESQPDAPIPDSQTSPGQPTGRIIFTCYISGFDEICAVDADGSNQEQLTRTDATDFYAEPSPDGRSITYSSRRSGSFQIWMMNANGSNQRQLELDLGGLYSSEISPDGRYLVLAAALGDEQTIWKVDLSTGQATAVSSSKSTNVDPVWSPDGTKIAFGSTRSGESAHYIVNADGTGLRQVETDIVATGGRSDWSPDGKWLAFYAGPKSDRDIYLAYIESSEVHRLTSGGNNLAPSFSPDGSWITFTSYRDGDAEIFIMRTDGTDVRQLTYNDRPDWQPRWGP